MARERQRFFGAVFSAKSIKYRDIAENKYLKTIYRFVLILIKYLPFGNNKSDTTACI